MTDGGSPSTEQVTGIQKLVSSSVPQMDSSDVTVIDGNGNEVSGSEDSEFGDATSLSSLKLQLEESAELSIKAKVKDLLESVYGAEKVRVAVNCTVDIDKKVSELLTYYPSEDGDNSGVTSKMTLDWEGMGNVESAGGVVGTESNSEVPTYPYLTEGDDGNYYADQRTYDYLVSQLTEQIQKDAGELTDTNVAVVIDSGSLSANDIRQITDLVGVTAGIPSESRSEKVSIMDANFSSSEESSSATQTIMDKLNLSPATLVVGGSALLILIVILIALAVILRKITKKRELQEAIFRPEYEEGEMDWKTEESIDLSNMESTKEQVLRDQIREFASQNPEITASLIKNWLRGDGEEE
jgi:flagellar M-ring protein FliF